VSTRIQIKVKGETRQGKEAKSEACLVAQKSEGVVRGPFEACHVLKKTDESPVLGVSCPEIRLKTNRRKYRTISCEKPR